MHMLSSASIMVKPRLRDELLACRILIIEDDPLARELLHGLFEQQGFRHIEDATHGAEGFEKTISFRPNLVITDILMPDVDGYEYCRRVRALEDKTLAQVPILVQTVLKNIAERTQVFDAGATDYLAKPAEPHEIMARSIVHLEREIMLRELRDFSHRIHQELDTARDSQRVLFPSNVLVEELSEQYSLEIHHHFTSSSELGGDFWGIMPLSETQLAVHMVDFSGHGVSAALNVFRLHALMHNLPSIDHAPGDYLQELNAILVPLLPSGQFATMFYGIIDIEEGTLAYASAAAPPPLLFHADRAHEALASDGLLLGVDAKATYETRTIPFDPGDCLLLYSDALIETPNHKGALWSVEDLAQHFKRAFPPYGDSFAFLLEEFNASCGDTLRDDLSITAFCRLKA